jgi:hypothetical protein
LKAGADAAEEEEEGAEEEEEEEEAGTRIRVVSWGRGAGPLSCLRLVGPIASPSGREGGESERE